MKHFLAIYLGTAEKMAEWNHLPETVRAERVAAGLRLWHAWTDHHRDAIVDPGSPLGRTKSVSPAGVADVRNEMAAYVVVRAPSHEAAARMFQAHPHFTIFPGTAVEVMECLPIPTEA